MQKLYSVFYKTAAAAVLLAININAMAQPGGNGLWQAVGSDTVTTNRQVAVTKNLQVKGLLTADSIKTQNGNFSVTDSVTITTYTRIEDSVRITGALKLGSGSLILSPLGAQTTTPNSIYTDNGDLFIQSSSGNNFNTLINANNTGNVGINTSSPTEQLDVDGNARIRQIPLLTGNADANHSIVISDNSSNAGTLNRIDFNGNSTSFLTGDGTFQTIADGSDHDWYEVGASAPPDAITDDIYKTSGNVGIGTNNPAFPLQVNGNVGSPSDALLNLVGNNPGDVDIRFENLGQVQGARIRSTLVGTGAELAFITGGRNRLRIDRNGNVGIGIINPAHKFVVDDGEVQANGTDDDGDGFIDENDPMVIVNNRGRVGIGNTAPGACLDIQNTGDNPPAQIMLLRNASGLGRFSVGDGGVVRAPNISGLLLPSGFDVVLHNGELKQVTSTMELKENIVDLVFNKDTFFLMRPRSYNWKIGTGSGSGNDIGLIAEEVAEIMPRLAVFGYKRLYNPDGSQQTDSIGNQLIDTSQVVPQGIDYNRLSVYMLALMKQHEDGIENSQAINNIQNDTINELKERISDLESIVSACCSSPESRIMNNNNSNNKAGNQDAFAKKDRQNNPVPTLTSISLEHTYPTNTVSTYVTWRMVKLHNSGTKYFAFNADSFKITLYNLDHTIFKIINIPQITQDDNYAIFYISENLFDMDNDIEYLALSPSAVKIYNEDGSILWEETDCTPNCVAGWIAPFSDPTTFPEGPILKTDSGFKMVIHANYSTGYASSIIKVYGLPGSLISSGLEIYDGEIPSQFLIYPNPSGNSATIEYSLPQGESKGEVVISNLTGGMVKKVAVNSSSGKIELDNTQLPAGTYFYQLQTAKGVAGTKKMILVK